MYKSELKFGPGGGEFQSHLGCGLGRMATRHDNDQLNVGEAIQERRRAENVQYLVNLTQIYMITAQILLALNSILLALILWRLW